jgi:protein SCO1/2
VSIASRLNVRSLSGGRLRAGVPRRAAALCIVAGSLAACSSAANDAPQNPANVAISGIHRDSTFHGAEPATPYRMPNLTLTADNGQPFNLVTDTGYRVTLVFYGYSHCPDVCPLVLSELAAAYVRLPSAVRQQTQVLFITTDPARDDAEVLQDYLAKFNPSFLGLTGKLSTIRMAAGDMGVPIMGVKRLPSGGYDVGHGAQVIGFRGNQAPVVWTEGTSISDMVSDIEVLAG